jgi:putative ABC transport system ATP-binding protein
MPELTPTSSPQPAPPAVPVVSSDPMDLAPRDDLDAVVAMLTRASDTKLDHARSRRAADAARAEGLAPLEVLARAVEATGLRVTRHHESPRALLSRHGAPGLLLSAATPRGLAVVSVPGPHRARLHHLVDAACDLSVNAAQLAQHLGAEGPEAPTSWLVTYPAEPLTGLTAHGDTAHGDNHGGHHGGHHGDHPSAFQRVRALLRMERDDLWVVVIYAVAVGLLSLVTPVAVQALVNSVAFGALLQPIVVLTLIVLAVLGFAALLRSLQVRVVEAVQRRIFVRVALDLANRLPRVDLGATDARYGPELVNRFFDVLTVQKSASIFLLDGLALLLQTSIGLLVLAFYHPVLLALDFVLLLGAVFVVFGLGRGATETSIDESRAKYAVAAWLEEIARLPRAFRANSGADLARSRADLLARRYLDARESHFRLVYKQIVGSLWLQVAANAAVLGVGGALVIQRQLTLGQLVAAELIVTVVVASIAKLGKHLETWYDLLAAADKLGHLADLPLEPRGEAANFDEHPRGASLHLREVGFSYGHGHAALRGLSLHLSPGARAVLLGESGAGKTTLAALLDGLRRPTEGSLEVDGVDLREVDLGALRERVVVVPRVAEVAEATVLENLAAGRPITRRDAWDALARVGLEELVRALPQGLDTPLAASGAPLHHGAVARLAVARALAARPRLLVIDGALEVLSAHDRARVEAAVFDPAAPWTLLVLTTPDDPVRRRADLTLALSPSAHPVEAH